jgi:putative FmdB family regulatory protein
MRPYDALVPGEGWRRDRRAVVIDHRGRRYTGGALPTYEFICNACKAPTSIFVRSISTEVNAKCEKCGSTDLTRAISGFAVLGAQGSDSGFDASDPDMAAMMQQMGGMGGAGGMDF